LRLGFSFASFVVVAFSADFDAFAVVGQNEEASRRRSNGCKRGKLGQERENEEKRLVHEVVEVRPEANQEVNERK